MNKHILVHNVFCTEQLTRLSSSHKKNNFDGSLFSIALIWKNEIEIRKLFVEMENIARKSGLQINQEKTKYMIVERKNSLKKDKIGHLKIKNYKLERVENFKYLVVFNKANNNQIDLQERIKNANKTYFMLQKLFKNKNTSKKLKLRLKNTIIHKMLTYAS